MKVLIWIGCCILHYIFSIIIKPIVYQIPVTDDRSILLVSTLYGILIAASFGCCFTLAKTLCKKWDLYKASKNAVKAETTTREYNSYQALLNENSEGTSLEETPNKPEPIETVAPNIKTNKKIKSKKPLIIVTYVLLISVIISLSVFCILSIQNKDNTINQLESDMAALQEDLKSVGNKLKAKENELKTIKANLKNTQNNLTDTNAKLSDATSSLTDARTDAAYWKEKYMASDPANVTYSYEFSSVNALITAIKKDPEAYHNKQVKVFGMLLTYNAYNSNKKYVKFVSLFDYKNENISFSPDDYEAEYLMRKKSEAKEAIDIILSSDLQYTVAETGDYVNLYGIVRITNGEIYLDKCQYN